MPRYEQGAVAYSGAEAIDRPVGRQFIQPRVDTRSERSVRLDEVLGEMSLKDAAKTVASELGVPKSRVYALGVKAKDENP
jgi:hypothetical protein